METLGIEEASAFLKIHPDTLSAMAKAKEIPGAKIGRRWVFIKSDLIEHIRSKYQVEEKPKCHSLSEVLSTGSICGIQKPGRGSDDLRALHAKRKLSSTTTK